MNGGQNDIKNDKVVVLFVPEELNKKYAVLTLLSIQKKDGRTSFTVSEINRKAVQQAFPELANAAKAIFLQFKAEQLTANQKEIELRYKKQKAGLSFSAFLQQSLLRQMHQQFGELKPYFSAVKWYHKVRKTDGKTLQTLACSFSTERPVLSFQLTKVDDCFGIEPLVQVNGTQHPLSQWNRTAFFLERENVYLLLAFKDYQTLEWLRQALSANSEPKLFLETVLPWLKEDYKITGLDLLNEKQLMVVPTCRVLFSELNQSFLLLTPQWLYDGMLVEGPWKETQEFATKTEQVVISRHRETEVEFVERLSSFHPNFAGQRNGYFYLTFAEAQKKQWFIKTYYQLLEQNVEIVGMDLLQHFRYSPHKPETTAEVREENGSFLRVHLSVHFGKESVSLATLQKALYAGQRAVVLKDGSLGVFSDEWLNTYGIILKHGRVHQQDVQVSKFLSFGDREKSLIQSWKPDVQEGWWPLWQQWQSQSHPIIPLPSTVVAELRPYQQKGFEWLVLLSQVGAGACLADDMGLGKTLQTICFLAWFAEHHPDQPQLIVCPTSLLYNWQNELEKFAPSLQTHVYHGASKSEAMNLAQVVITSYGTLRNGSDELVLRHYGVVVIDESHNIKNPSAQITQAVQQLQSATRIALSGTPVVNNTFDLYTQLSFVVPGLLGAREFFKREYADAIDRFGDESKIKALQRLTAPFILRRTKEQVARDLPEKSEQVLWCTMSAQQEEVYNEIREQIRSNLFMDLKTEGVGKTKLAVLQGLLKLRQICNDPRLLPVAEHGGRVQSAKTEMLIGQLLQVLKKHTVLVFSQFSSMLHLLAQECDQRRIDFFLLDGQTPAEKRAQMVRDFQENCEAPQLFLISLKAGNTGLTLTAADYVFLFDPWWNTAVEQQAVDRTHRIGQTKNVFAYKLVCRNTVEEKILELQQRKKHLAEELIAAEDAFVKNLSEEEIAYLFS